MQSNTVNRLKRHGRLLLIILLMMPVWAIAQVQVSGLVKSGDTPVAGANVVVKNGLGNMAGGTVTREDGSFELKLAKDTYTILISALGYISWEKIVVLQKDTALGTILLQQNSTSLETFVVTAKKKLVEYKQDRLVLNVENNIAATGGNALNVISTAPGVMVQNNNITMLGKGTTRVMVDGRMIELTGEELANYLKSIAAADIKSIEVITNPPAKYDAAGDGGIINIVLKKARVDSWKNALTATYDQNSYDFYTLRNSFLYNKNKLRLAVSAGGKLGHSRAKQELNIAYPNGPRFLQYIGKQKENNASGRVAMDYDLSGKTMIGFQYAANFNDPGSRDLVKSDIYNTAHQLDSSLLNTGNRKLSNSSHALNAHLVSQLDSAGKKLSVDADLFRYHSSIDNSFVANTFTPDMQFLHTIQSAQNIAAQQIDNVSIKTDLEHPLKFLNLSYGIKAAYTRSKGDIVYYNTITGIPEQDASQSNTFEYKETNQAVYINGIKSIGKWNVQAGLRMEYTQTKGYSATLNQVSDNDYLKLFPTFSLSYKRNDDHYYLLSYGRRISRPGFALLNPFRSYINSTSYSEGNPFLQPSFSDDIDVSHVYKGAWRTNLFLNIASNGFGPVFTADPQTNALIISRQNYFREYYYGIGENYSANITPWWQSVNTMYVMGAQSRFNGKINASPANSLQFYLATSNTFSFSKISGLQVDYMYSSPFKRGLYEIGYLSRLNIAFRQGFLKNQLQLSLLCNDVFNTAYLKNYASVVNGIRQVYSENNSSRFFHITLTWNIGNDKVKVQQRGFGNEEERGRTN
ncbi:MAG: TonB-dependent receptor [Chitinophagaceae bacterium]